MEETKMKPLDALGDALDKQVIVKTKNGLEIAGTLKAFDMHVNIVLADARFKDREMDGSIVEKKLGQIFIRGDTIIMVM